MKTKTIIVVFLLAFFTIDSFAVPYPEKINWNASPTAFITSLYQGVLGRNPESSKVVNEWAGNITSQSSSRLKVFWMFVNSREYQATRWAKQKREYSIYYKTTAATNRYKSYYVSKNGRDYYVQGKFTFGVAMAVKNYHATFDRASESYRGNSNSINLLNTKIKGT